MAPPKLDVTAHVGDRAVLLAFDVPHDDADGLAGFAVFVTPPKGKPYWLKNRLSFTRTTGSGNEMRYFDSHDAPFQMFHWVHFPPEGPGTYRYEVTSRYFVDRVRATLRDGAKKELEVEIPEQQVADKVKVTIGMTRGYVSSQAFIDRFGGNADLTPDPWSPDADVSAFEPRYHFLGAHARELTLAFLDKVKSDRLDLDVFAYDLNSPEVVQRIAAIAKAGQTVRLFQDDSVGKDRDTGEPNGHGLDDSQEKTCAAFLEKAGVEVQFGHFSRFAHDKVFIAKKGKTALRVLTGSMNFSTRGIYVQSNHVLVIDDEDVATLYETAFEQAFTEPRKFRQEPISQSWLPSINDPFSISFAPHKQAFPLDRVAQAINGSSSSVLFAIMEANSGGPVTAALRDIGDDTKVLSLGTIESRGELKLFKPGSDGNSSVVSFDFLRSHAPEPFKDEVDAGDGRHIHHKFVVCDFNGAKPVVFCGSSNLAAGGETSNGDNLLAIEDRNVATCFAVEAVRLFDHYRFRSRQQHAPASKPLLLDKTNEWFQDFYNPHNLKSREREEFIKQPLPAALAGAKGKLPIGGGGPRPAKRPAHRPQKRARP